MVRVFLVLALALTIAFLDLMSPPTIGLGFVYLGPVVASAYFFGWYGGIFMTALCLGTYHWIGLSKPTHISWVFHPANTWLEFGGMIAAAAFTSRLVKINEFLQQATRTLEANLQQKETIFQSVAGGILLVDRRLSLLDMNPQAEKLLGVRLVENRNRPIHIALLDFEVQRFFRKLASDSTSSLTERFAVKNPEPRTLEFTATPIPAGTGQPSTSGWAVAIQDLTDLVSAHEVLLSKAHTLAVQDTRNRMARDLHDNLAQTLASVHMRMSALRESIPQNPKLVAQWEKVMELLVRILKETRQNIWELRPTALEHMEFLPALENYISEMATMESLQGHLAAEGKFHLDPDREVLLFYVIQEALMNAQKHARAQNVYVILKSSPEQIQVEIRDDGEGFDPEAQRIQPLRKSYGLTTMQERVGLLGGEFTLKSARGKGTTVQIVVPVKEAREAVNL